MTTHIQAPAGNVVTLENDAARTHTYSAPDGGQLMSTYATELADYVESLGKPVEQLILSALHPKYPDLNTDTKEASWMSETTITG